MEREGPSQTSKTLPPTGREGSTRDTSRLLGGPDAYAHTSPVLIMAKAGLIDGRKGPDVKIK